MEFTYKELMCLNQMISIALTSGQIEFNGVSESVHKKVAREITKWNRIPVNNNLFATDELGRRRIAMSTPHIEVKQKGIVSEVFIDGQKVEGVRKISFKYDCASHIPVLQLEFLATDMSINGTIVPDLPEVLKPFYVKRDYPTK